MFIRNAWYIAAWADEIGQAPFARRILDEPIVIFKDAGGKLGALEDRCCHRGTPLAFGAVIPAGLQCGYHGLVFDASGQCVLVPGDHKIPRGARVRSYPVVEKDAFVWIWMGEPARADRALILDYPYHNDAKNWPHRHTTYPIRCDYMLMIDNLMDLSHLGYIHGGTIGGMPLTHVQAQMHVMRTPNGVRFDRWMLNSVPPPTYAKAAGFKGRVESLAGVRVRRAEQRYPMERRGRRGQRRIRRGAAPISRLARRRLLAAAVSRNHAGDQE